MDTTNGQPITINSVSVETPQGYKTFSLMQGDITLLSTDLLIISSHGNPQMRPTGQVIDSLKARYELEIDPDCRWLDFAEGRWTCFQRPLCPAPFSAILTVRIPSLLRQIDPFPFFDETVQGVFASVAALEYMGEAFRVISVPVLYGQRIMNEHDGGAANYPLLIESMIRHALRWLKKSDQSHTVQFVVYEEKQVKAWNKAMDRTLGRSVISAGADGVLKSLCQEIVHAIRSQPDTRLASAALPLADALAHPNRLSIQNVCVWSRKLVEAMLDVLMPIFEIKPARDLATNIDQLGRSRAVAPWIVSYMHSLRIFGNESVHARGEVPGYQPTCLEKGDLVSALSAVRSLLTVWAVVASGPPAAE